MTRNSLHIMKYSVLMLLAVILLLVSLPGVFCISPPEEEWRVTLGGSNEDGVGEAHQTRDGGYIIGGHWGESSESGSTFRACIIKLDKDRMETGRLILDETPDTYSSVRASVENGDGSITALIHIYPGLSAKSELTTYRLVKVSEDLRNILFNTLLTNEGYISSVDATEDGGYILTGSIGSSIGSPRGEELRLMKVDQTGSVEWDKTFTGSLNSDVGHSVKETNDGYIITGIYDETEIYEGSSGEIGTDSGKLWLFKTNRDGDRLWDKTFGDFGVNRGDDIELTSNGDYIIAGTKGFTSSLFSWDSVWLIKTDSSGNMLWEKTWWEAYPTSGSLGQSLDITSDGGYIITNGDLIEIPLIRTDKDGNELWSTSFSTSAPDGLWGTSVEQTSDGGYIIAGNLFKGSSFLFDTDILLIKVGPEELDLIKDVTMEPPDPTAGHKTRFRLVWGDDGGTYRLGSIKWFVTDEQGTVLIGNENPIIYSPAKGTYGRKTVTCLAYFEDRDHIKAEIYSEDFKLFFHPFENDDYDPNHPNDTPNWYDYWIKSGAVPNLDKMIYDPNLPGGYGAYDIKTDKLYIGKNAAKEMPATQINHYAFGGPDTSGIDCAAVNCAHEIFHQYVYNNLQGGSDSDEWQGPNGREICFKNCVIYDKGDACPDDLPDDYESQPSVGTDPMKPDTYNVEAAKYFPQYESIYSVCGDQEYMAMRESREARGDPSKDWANPGKQTSKVSYAAANQAEDESCSREGVAVASDGGSYSDEGVDLNGNSLYDYLTVQASINASNNGMLGIVAWLEDPQGEMITSINDLYPMSAGINDVDLNFNGTDINWHRVNGPYTLSLKLYSMYELDGRSMESRIDIYNTTAYNYADFEGAQGEFTGNYVDRGIDIDGDSIYDLLKVDVGVRTTIPGNYTIKGHLFSGERAIAFDDESAYLGSGVNNLSLSFDGKSIAMSKLNGPYRLSYLDMYDEHGTRTDSVLNAYNTSPYRYTDFLSSSALFTNSYSDGGSDINGDGLYDYLAINLGVNVTCQGNYTIQGILYDINGNETAVAFNTTHLDSGVQTAVLKFDGRSIYGHRVNGPYNLTNLWICDENGTLMDNAYQAHITSAYSYTDFAYPIRLIGDFSDGGVDENGNGLFDHLRVSLGVVATNNGTCIAEARLVDGNGMDIASASNRSWIEGSIPQEMILDFEGVRIYGSLANGPYHVSDLYVYQTRDPSYRDYSRDAYVTDDYSYKEFERSGISISGMKYEDFNGNGTRDDGEPGISNWTIRLERPAGKVMRMLTTASNGSYTFEDLAPDTYVMSEGLNVGWIQTQPSNGTYVASLEDESIVEMDFGNRKKEEEPEYSISGIKFDDRNGNGIRDMAEEGLPGWTIELNKIDSDSMNPLKNTTTGTSGEYIFQGLKSGNYIVSEVSRKGWTKTYPVEDYYEIEISDEDVGGIDFGNNQYLFSISGRKFNDLNRNGLNDTGEPGLSNWIILLSIDGIGLEKTATDISGHYRFDGLEPGDYILEEDMQDGWVQTYPPERIHKVSLKGGDISEIDFGNSKSGEPEYSISGVKFNDINGNAKNDGEPGLEGWTIILAGSDGFLMKATTDKYGEYSFKGLKKGEYSVYEADVKEWIRTKPPLSGRYLLKVDRDITGIDFGNRRPWISGVKFADLNKNGQREDEPGLPDWEITLTPYISAEPIDPPIFFAKTDSCGRFLFTDILPGKYIVNEVLQEGWVRTYPAWSSDSKEDIPLSKIDGHVIDVEFSDVTGINFGNYPQKAVEETAKV